MATIKLPSTRVESSNRLIPVGKYEAQLRNVRCFGEQLSWEFFIEGQGTIFQTQKLSHPVGLQVLAGTMDAFDLDVNDVFENLADEANDDGEIAIEKILLEVLAQLENVHAKDETVMVSVKHKKDQNNITRDQVSSVWVETEEDGDSDTE